MISPKDLKRIPELINERNDIPEFDSIVKSTVFNVNKSAKIGGDFLKEMINERLENTS